MIGVQPAVVGVSPRVGRMVNVLGRNGRRIRSRSHKVNRTKRRASDPKKNRCTAEWKKLMSHLSALLPRVRSVAIRCVFGELTRADRRLSRGLSFESSRRERRSLVRSVAPRLVRGLAATAPEIGLPFFQVDQDGGFAR